MADAAPLFVVYRGGLADQLQADANKDIQRAKEGLGSLGQFAVDVGVGAAQLAGDMAVGAATGGSAAIPVAVRSFGGKAQEARQEGATLDKQVAAGLTSALTGLVTEKISSVGNIQTKAFGSGALDDILEGVVAAVEKTGKTKAGKAALNRLASAGVGALGEGLEEGLESVIDQTVTSRIYSDKPIDWKQVAEEAVYSGLVGGAIGSITGGLGGTNTSSWNSTAETQQESVNTRPQISRSADLQNNGGQATQKNAQEGMPVNKNAGLVKDDNWKKADLSSRDNLRLDALGKVLGTEIRFAETIDNGAANAKYENGVISLALDAKDPVITSVIHETVHRIRETDTEVYAALNRFVQTHLSEESRDMNLAVRETLYKTADKEYLTEEMVADAFGRVLNDGKVLDRFVKDNRNVAQKVLDVVRDIINAVQRTLNAQNLKLSQNQKDTFADLSGQLGEMEVRFVNALKQVENSLRANYNEDTKYSAKQQEVSEYGRAEAVSDPGYAEGTGRVGENAPGGTGSRAAIFQGKIKELLQQKASGIRNQGNAGGGRVEQRENIEDFESRVRRDGMHYYESPGGQSEGEYKWLRIKITQTIPSISKNAKRCGILLLRKRMQSWPNTRHQLASTIRRPQSCGKFPDAITRH